MTIQVKVERRWRVEIETGEPRTVVFCSVDGDVTKATVAVMGSASVVVSVADLIDALKNVAAHTSGIPRGIDEDG